MAKNTGGEGKGQTKNVSPEQHEAARRAAKAKRNAAARARAHGSKAGDGPRTTGNLFDDIRNDRRQDFLNAQSARRQQQAAKAEAILMEILEDTLRGHADESFTAEWANRAHEASMEMVTLYLVIDPEFFGTRNNKVKTTSMDIVEAEMRKRLAKVGNKRFTYTVIELTRNALYGVKPRAARKLAIA